MLGELVGAEGAEDAGSVGLPVEVTEDAGGGTLPVEVGEGVGPLSCGVVEPPPQAARMVAIAQAIATLTFFTNFPVEELNLPEFISFLVEK